MEGLVGFSSKKKRITNHTKFPVEMKGLVGAYFWLFTLWRDFILLFEKSRLWRNSLETNIFFSVFRLQ